MRGKHRLSIFSSIDLISSTRSKEDQIVVSRTFDAYDDHIPSSQQIYKKNSDKHEFWGREYGQKYTSEQLRIDGLEYFFHDGEQFRLDVAEGVLDSLRYSDFVFLLATS